MWGKKRMAEPIKGNITQVSHVRAFSVQYYDPVAEKLKELEERINAWQNKFEFVNVKEK